MYLMKRLKGQINLPLLKKLMDSKHRRRKRLPLHYNEIIMIKIESLLALNLCKVNKRERELHVSFFFFLIMKSRIFKSFVTWFSDKSNLLSFFNAVFIKYVIIHLTAQQVILDVYITITNFFKILLRKYSQKKIFSSILRFMNKF